MERVKGLRLHPHGREITEGTWEIQSGYQMMLTGGNGPREQTMVATRLLWIPGCLQFGFMNIFWAISLLAVPPTFRVKSPLLPLLFLECPRVAYPLLQSLETLPFVLLPVSGGQAREQSQASPGLYPQVFQLLHLLTLLVPGMSLPSLCSIVPPTQLLLFSPPTSIFFRIRHVHK